MLRRLRPSPRTIRRRRLTPASSIQAGPGMDKATQRFVGKDSIYHDATNAPAATAYDPTAAIDASASSIQAGPGIAKQTQRFVGMDSIYNADLSIPAVTAYDLTAAKDASASSIQAGPGMEKATQGLVGKDSIYHDATNALCRHRL